MTGYWSVRWLVPVAFIVLGVGICSVNGWWDVVLSVYLPLTLYLGWRLWRESRLYPEAKS